MGTYNIPFSVTQLNSYRTSWSNDKNARQGAYGGKYPTEYVGRIKFSIGDFNTVKYKITGVTLTVNRSKIGNWGGQIALRLYAGQVDPGTLRSEVRKGTASYVNRKLSDYTLNTYSNNPSTIVFSAADVNKFNTYCINSNSYALMMFSNEGNQTENSDDYTYYYAGLTSVTMTITYTERMAPGTASNATLGTSNFITFTHLGTGFKYQARWELGSLSTTRPSASTFNDGSSGSISYTIPTSWGSQFPTSFSKVGKVTLITFDSAGNKIGEDSHSITYSCPNTAEPTGSFSQEDVNVYKNSSGTKKLLAGLSKKNVTLIGSSSYGAQVEAKIVIKKDNQILKTSSDKTGVVLTNYLLESAGTYTVEQTITDSRGLSTTLTNSTWTVVQGPNFSNIKIERANSSGTAQDNGTYLQLSGTLSNSTDEISVKCTWNDNNATKKTDTLKALGTATKTKYLSSVAVFSADFSSDIQILIKSNIYVDSNNNNVVYSIPGLKMSSANYLLHFKQGGKAIGIGSAAGVEDKTVTFGWQAIFNAGFTLTEPLAPSSGGTGVASLSALWNTICSNSNTNAAYQKSLKVSSLTSTGTITSNGTITASSLTTTTLAPSGTNTHITLKSGSTDYTLYPMTIVTDLPATGVSGVIYLKKT